MTQSQEIARNTLWQIIGKGVGTILGLITVGLLTRYLGQEGFGYYTTALAFMQFFGVILDMGLFIICLKEISIAPEKESEILGNFISLRFWTALIIMGIGCLLIFFFPYPPMVKWSGLIVSLSFLSMSLVQILTSVFQKNLKMGQVAVAEVIGRIAFALVIVLFIFFKGNLPFLMIGNLANTLVYLIVLRFLAKKLVVWKWRADFSYWKKILRQTWPIALGIVFNLVYFRADTIILSLYRPAAEVGIYGAPYKILEVITTFPHMFMGLVMPLLTAAWLVRDSEKLKNLCQKTFDFFAVITVPMLLGSLPLATRLMKLIAGPEFVESGKILPILMLATAIIFFGNIFTYNVVIFDKQKSMLKFYFIGAILSLIGYFTLIPVYSYFGAAWVTVAVEALIALTAWIIFYRSSKVKISLKIFNGTLFAGLAMAAAILILDSILPLFVLLMLAGLIYFSILFLTKTVDKKFIASLVKNS